VHYEKNKENLEEMESRMDENNIQRLDVRNLGAIRPIRQEEKFDRWIQPLGMTSSSARI
jgi:hypothetical protein